MLELLLIVGQDPRQSHVVGYNLNRPMYGSLSPRKIVGDNDTLITQLDVNTSNGDVIMVAKKPILGATPTLTLPDGESASFTYTGDTYTSTTPAFANALTVGSCIKIMVDTEATTVATTSPQAKVDLDGMTKTELIAYAKDKGIAVDASLTKALILKIVKSA